MDNEQPIKEALRIGPNETNFPMLGEDLDTARLISMIISIEYAHPGLLENIFNLIALHESRWSVYTIIDEDNSRHMRFLKEVEESRNKVKLQMSQIK